MARSHARLLASIWEDDDFITLPPGAQRMYMFLISQRDLQHCGVIALRERRWSKKACGMTADGVRTELEVLAARRYVIIDDDAEELLVRSLMRRDKVYAQPNVFKAAADQIRAVSSREIRTVLLEELERLPLEELKGETRGVHGGLIVELSGLLGRGSATPSGTPSEQVPSEPRGKGSGYGEEVEDPPFPDPLSGPPPAGAAAPRAAAEAPTQQNLTITQRSKRITDAYAVVEPMCKWPSINGIVIKAIKAEKWSDEEIQAALLRLADEGRGVTIETLRRELAGDVPSRGRDSPAQSRNAQILNAARQRALAAEQQANATVTHLRGAITA